MAERRATSPKLPASIDYWEITHPIEQLILNGSPVLAIKRMTAPVRIESKIEQCHSLPDTHGPDPGRRPARNCLPADAHPAGLKPTARTAPAMAKRIILSLRQAQLFTQRGR